MSPTISRRVRFGFTSCAKKRPGRLFQTSAAYASSKQRGSMPDATAKAKMLIRAQVADVFAAFVDPQRLREFWLKSASGPLQPNAHVEWEFMLPGARETVDVLAFSTNEHIKFKWSNGNVVDLTFDHHANEATRVEVLITGFGGDDPFMQAVNATEGFAIVLCDLKSLLETGKSGGMVRDKALLIAEETALR
jgi:uncharacterized protein YndB with AHSA1/START domain